jgi:RNA polymerase sigma-70 factor (ECF subfamily)
VNWEHLIRVVMQDHNQIRMRVGKWLYPGECVEDVIQEAYLRILRASTSEIKDPIAYLMTVCRHIVWELHDRRRREIIEYRIHSEYIDPQLTPEARAIFESEMEYVIAAMRNASPKCKKVFELHRVDQYSYSEIAKQCQISESMVKKYLDRANHWISEYETRLSVRYASPRTKRSGNRKGEFKKSKGG